MKHVSLPVRVLTVALSLTPVVLLTGCVPSAPTSKHGSAETLHRSTNRPSPPPSGRVVVATREELAATSFNVALERLAHEATAKAATLVIPAGDYTATATAVLPPGLVLRLAPKAVITGALPGSPLVRIGARSAITGGTLRNTAPSPGFDLDIDENAAEVRIGGVTFAGTSPNALYLDAPRIRDVLVEQCHFNHVGYGILLNPGAHDAHGIVIRSNTFRDVHADAIEINAATGGTDERVREVTIRGNDIGPSSGSGDSSGFGVGLAGVRGFAVRDNVIRGARTEAIHLEDGTSNGSIDYNVVTDGGVGDRPAIALYKTTESVVVKANRISRFDGSGIGVRWDQQGSAKDITVRANTIDNVSGDAIVVAGGEGTGPFIVSRNLIRAPGGHGIAVSGSHERSVITDNTFRNVHGDPIAQSLRGAGVTTIGGNVILPN